MQRRGPRRRPPRRDSRGGDVGGGGHDGGGDGGVGGGRDDGDGGGEGGGGGNDNRALESALGPASDDEAAEMMCDVCDDGDDFLADPPVEKSRAIGRY